MRNTLLEFQTLCKSFGDVIAVDNVSLEIAAGEIVSLIGSSGCGKTTLARMVAGLETPDKGEVIFDGQPIVGLSVGNRRHVCRKIQMVFQDPYSSLSFRQRVCEIVAEPLRILRVQKPYAEKISAMLRTVGLSEEDLSKYPFELSGGERQRVAIARSMIVGPRLLIADEIVSLLDCSRKLEILDLLSQLRVERGLSVLFITHDIAVAAYVSDRIAVMQDGRIIETGDVMTVLKNPIHSQTKAMVHAAKNVAMSVAVK